LALPSGAFERCKLAPALVLTNLSFAIFLLPQKPFQVWSLGHKEFFDLGWDRRCQVLDPDSSVLVFLLELADSGLVLFNERFNHIRFLGGRLSILEARVTMFHRLK